MMFSPDRSRAWLPIPLVAVASRSRVGEPKDERGAGDVVAGEPVTR
jgi:hypothetical protein